MSHAEDNAGTRRDFLYFATAGAGAVATGAAVWPLINQMNPSADVQALASIFVLPSMLTIWARWSERRAASRQPAIGSAAAPLPGGDAPA